MGSRSDHLLQPSSAHAHPHAGARTPASRKSLVLLLSISRLCTRRLPDADLLVVAKHQCPSQGSTIWVQLHSPLPVSVWGGVCVQALLRAIIGVCFHFAKWCTPLPRMGLVEVRFRKWAVALLQDPHRVPLVWQHVSLCNAPPLPPLLASGSVPTLAPFERGKVTIRSIRTIEYA